MGVEIARKKNGSLRSKWWYGRFTVNGKDTTINLGVEIKGSAPASLRKTGDKAFEHSRLKAQVKLDGLISEARSQKSAEKHLEELYELKSGSSIEHIPVGNHWSAIVSSRKLIRQRSQSNLGLFRDGKSG